ncbi:hypothetical protein V5F77_09215 [Xanthobacter sp. DSM 24535]|uniref:hypothetical protein n=1 Tax=Roseixanthobacter psychrophilus TaxID=3119917 RepID=UPI003727D091
MKTYVGPHSGEFMVGGRDGEDNPAFCRARCCANFVSLNFCGNCGFIHGTRALTHNICAVLLPRADVSHETFARTPGLRHALIGRKNQGAPTPSPSIGRPCPAPLGNALASLPNLTDP